MPDPELPDSSNQTLSDIVRGMQHAVNESQRMLEVHFLDVLNRYFDDDRNPKMVEFRVRDDHVIRAPLITLIHPNGLHLSDLELQFAIRVQREAVKELPSPEDMELKRELEAKLRQLRKHREEEIVAIEKLRDAAQHGDHAAMVHLERREAALKRLDAHIAELQGELRSVISRSSVSVSFAPRTGESDGSSDSVIDVTMKFKAEPQPEGMSRIIDEFTRGIGPVHSPAQDQPLTPALDEPGGGNDTDPDIPPDSA